jgi:hypothetical protein
MPHHYSQSCRLFTNIWCVQNQAVGYYSNSWYYSKYYATIQNQNLYSIFATTSLSNIRLLFYRIVRVGKTKFYSRCATMFVKSYTVLTACLTTIHNLVPYSQIYGVVHNQAVGYYSNSWYYSKYSATIQNQNFYSVFTITSLSNIRLLFYRIILVGETKFYSRCSMMFVKSYSVLTTCLTNLLQKKQSFFPWHSSYEYMQQVFTVSPGSSTQRKHFSIVIKSTTP